MRYGKMQIVGNEVRFTKRVKRCVVPCEDIFWAYRRRDDSQSYSYYRTNPYVMNTVILRTKMGKIYEFQMTAEEAKACLEKIKEKNPELIVGFPKGGRVPLKSLMNTRDLGGFRSEDGRYILPYQLLRSGELYHTSKDDIYLLREEYHLNTVIDLRTPLEQEKKPDTMMEGVLYIDNPILDEETVGITREGDSMQMLSVLEQDPDGYMRELYRNLILDSYARTQYAKFFEYLTDHGDGAILWHCSVGKDRVGIATVLLLSALGIPRGAIIDDYMRTNTYLKEDVDYLTRLMQMKCPEKHMENIIRVMLGTKESYIQSVFDAINENYGSMDRYLRKAMGLTPKRLEKLKNRYLV